MTMTADDPRSIFDRLVHTDPPEHPSPTIGTACVLGGSVAGLLAARVLADHARTVIVVERDDVNTDGRSRAAVPHDLQLHALLPAGRAFLDRWLPGFTRDAIDRGAVPVGPDQFGLYVGEQRQAHSKALSMVAATRPFLESSIRSRVLAIPNVHTVSASATGLMVRDDAVRTVRLVDGGTEHNLDVDFTVDAMGRSSKLSDWIEQAGYQRPRLERLPAEINYATALFERSEDASEAAIVGAQALPANPVRPERPYVFLAAVEDRQWMVLLMGYGDDRPPRTIDGFRTACAPLPPVFGRAVGGRVTRGIETYRQADSRRRDFTDLGRYPSRVVSIGDAVASFNPIYGQGMSSAALQVSALSRFLTSDPDLDRTATDFFTLQSVVVDAAWTTSAGVDAARLDALSGVDVPPEVRRRRWGLEQVMHAAQIDPVLCEASGAVTGMLAHPSTLTDRDVVDRAVAVNQQRAAVG
jgi:2-polyprenyl-6-methoxyphenol hydroxylase-like FAD-dependent oxidoreductase